jgi:hypothetical protein
MSWREIVAKLLSMANILACMYCSYTLHRLVMCKSEEQVEASRRNIETRMMKRSEGVHRCRYWRKIARARAKHACRKHRKGCSAKNWRKMAINRITALLALCFFTSLVARTLGIAEDDTLIALCSVFMTVSSLTFGWIIRDLKLVKGEVMVALVLTAMIVQHDVQVVQAACEIATLDDVIGTSQVRAVWNGEDCVKSDPPAPSARYGHTMVSIPNTDAARCCSAEVA